MEVSIEQKNMQKLIDIEEKEKKNQIKII